MRDYHVESCRVQDTAVCPICIDEVTIKDDALRSTTCKCASVYHKACLEPWLASKATCPTCRENLRKQPYVDAYPYNNYANIRYQYPIYNYRNITMGDYLSSFENVMDMFGYEMFLDAVIGNSFYEPFSSYCYPCHNYSIIF
jgi:hypothetical protein